MAIVVMTRVNANTATRQYLYDNDTLQYDERVLQGHGHLMTTEDIDAMMQTLDTCANQEDKYHILRLMLTHALQYALPAVIERVTPLLLNECRQLLNTLQSSAEQQGMQQQQQIRDVGKEIQKIKEKVIAVFRISALYGIDDYSRIKYPGVNPTAPKTKAAIALAIRQDQQKIMDCWVRLVKEEFFEFREILSDTLQKEISQFLNSDGLFYRQMVVNAEDAVCTSLFRCAMRVVHKHGLFKLAELETHPVGRAYTARYGVLAERLVDENETQQQQQQL